MSVRKILLKPGETLVREHIINGVLIILRYTMLQDGSIVLTEHFEILKQKTWPLGKICQMRLSSTF